MKMRSLLLLAAIALTVPAFAQTPGPAGPGAKPGWGGRGGGPMGRMAKINAEIFKQLNLTPDQDKRIKDLQKKTAESARAKLQGAQGDREKMKDAMKDLRKGYQDGLDAILTPAQQAKYKTLRKEAVEKMRAERKKNGPPPVN